MDASFAKEVEVQLTPDELAERKNQLVAIDQKIHEVADEKKSRVADFNSVLKEHKDRQKKLLDAIATGVEFVELEVFERRDERRGHIDVVRVDTGEVLQNLSRPMTFEERQLNLVPDDEAPPARKRTRMKHGFGTPA